MCGGTGLYIKAFREGLDEIPVIDEGIRKNIIKNFHEQGFIWLSEAIRNADPLFFSSGEMANPHRMMRALEVIQSTGRSIISFGISKRNKDLSGYWNSEYGYREKNYIKELMHGWIIMMQAGLLEEVNSLLPYQHLNALQTVGYSELFDYIKGKSTLEDSISLMKQNTRHYAKRQMTWLNKRQAWSGWKMIS